MMAVIVWDMCQPDRRRWKGGGPRRHGRQSSWVPLLFIAYLLVTRRFPAGGASPCAAFGRHGRDRVRRAAAPRR